MFEKKIQNKKLKSLTDTNMLMNVYKLICCSHAYAFKNFDQRNVLHPTIAPGLKIELSDYINIIFLSLAQVSQV